MIIKHRIKTILKYKDLINVWLVLTVSFIENTFKLGYIYIKRVSALLKSI